MTGNVRTAVYGGSPTKARTIDWERETPPGLEPGVLIWGTQIAGGTVMLRISGELDRVGSQDLHAAITAQLDREMDVVLDLAKVTFIDGAGIDVLHEAVREFAWADRSLKLAGAVGPQVRRALSSTGIAHFLRVA